MRGAGFQCDRCGRTVVTYQDVFMMNSNPMPPTGWFVLSGPAPAEAMHAVDRKEFCSMACVGYHAREEAS